MFGATTLKGKVGGPCCCCAGDYFIDSLTDYIRSPPNPSRCFDATSISVTSFTEVFCTGAQTNSHPAMCLFGSAGYTNDRVEGCRPLGRICTREWCCKSRLHSRISKSSPRRSHRGAKNRIDSTWTERLKPTGIRIDIKLGELQNMCLMDNIRKTSWEWELRSYWSTTQARLYNSWQRTLNPQVKTLQPPSILHPH